MCRQEGLSKLMHEQSQCQRVGVVVGRGAGTKDDSRPVRGSLQRENLDVKRPIRLNRGHGTRCTSSSMVSSLSSCVFKSCAGEIASRIHHR
jgi:hypothetical protein